MVVVAICLESSEAKSFRDRWFRRCKPLNHSGHRWQLCNKPLIVILPRVFISLVLLTREQRWSISFKLEGPRLRLWKQIWNENIFSGKMDNWIVSQISFWFTVRKVKPAQVVDQIINFWLDVTVPGRGTGENNWVMRGVRSVQQGAERTQAELDIRSNLNRWDKDYPEIHHELLVRWGCGLVASLIVSSLYQALKPQPRYRKYWWSGWLVFYNHLHGILRHSSISFVDLWKDLELNAISIEISMHWGKEKYFSWWTDCTLLFPKKST